MKPTSRNIYHLFTLGFCGAPQYHENEETVNRLKKIEKIIPYLKEMGINTLLLGPLFGSISHGYDVSDYYEVDTRLGTREDLKALIEKLHENGIDVLFDAVFNHTGREHPFYLDLKERRENSPYRDYYRGVNFWGNNSFGDGLSYENWAGHDNLVKLNLDHPDVKAYFKDVLADWIDEFDIDGIRLDAANVMSRPFLAEISDFAHNKKDDFFIFGEIVGGDYRELAQNGHLDSVTNYECYKGLYSSLNDKNYFEIAHSIRRLFDNGALLSGIPAFNFVDNHDVERVATTLRDKRLLKPLYLLLYTMPGVPSVYYGSEQGIEAKKEWGSDASLRPEYESIDFDKKSDLYKFITKLGKLRRKYPVLEDGTYRELFILPQQYGFLREGDDPAVILLNMQEEDVTVPVGLNGNYRDVLNDEDVEIEGEVEIPAFSGRILFMEEK